jgi:PAS domain S-box-containing protein
MQNEELHRIQRELRESLNRYQDLYDFAPLGYLTVDGKGFILEANLMVTRLLDVERASLIGKPLSYFVSKEDADTFYLKLREVVETPLKQTWEMRLNNHSNGAQIHAQVDGMAAQDREGNFAGARIVISDITERKRREDTQRRLSTAIEQAAEGILITDTDGIIQYVNPSLEHISGYNKTELLGTKSNIFKSDEHDQALFKDLWDTINAGNVWTGRFTNKRKDGVLYYVDATITPVKDSSGKIINFVVVKRDVTERLELSRQLLQAQKMEAIGTLAGGVAHDFNNILQIVLGYSEVLLQGKKAPEFDYEDVEKIYQAGKRGAELVKGLMMFSRKAEIQPKPINLNEQVEQLTRMLARTIPKMIEIERILAPDLAIINADATQMDQVVMNLAVNAKDAMHDEGKLTIETASVVLDDEYCRAHAGVSPGPYVLLMVSDTGHGMNKEILARIFEPFFTTKAEGKGTGLGLSTVYGIVKQHNGSIDCESEPGHGTTFKIYVPAISRREAVSESTTKETGPKGGTETILVVDDEESVRGMIGQILSRAGYKLMTACDGKEALDLYKQEGAKISLVILDLMMPKMGGQKCLEELLKINPQAKVLIATGVSSNNQQTSLTIDSGAKVVIHKPYDINLLLTTVRDILDRD